MYVKIAFQILNFGKVTEHRVPTF